MRKGVKKILFEKLLYGNKGNTQLGLNEIRTRVRRFKVFCANHYTIRPYILIPLLHEVGVEPTHLTITGLKSVALDHSAIRALFTSSIKKNFFENCCSEPHTTYI